MSFTHEYNLYCETHGIPDRIELMLCDLNSILRGKWLPGDAWEKLEKGQVRLPLSTYAPNIMGQEVEETGMGIVVGDPDGILKPVLGSLAPVPWAEGNVAQVLVEMSDMDGVLSPYSPRGVLQNVLDRFAAHGWTPIVATELEFYIFQKRDSPDDAPIPPQRAPSAQNFDLEVLSRKDAILSEIMSASAAQNLATDTLIAEFGPGQFEINFHHTGDVQRAAETALLFRRLVRQVVAKHGMEATFIAKPYADDPGNGMHAHISVVDQDGNNIFDAGGPVSGRLKNAVGGTLDTMRDLQAIFAPHMNSYRRFQPNSFAPTAPNWGLDNRQAGVRLPEISGPAARLEHRICGADVNPYLALAAILGGMLFGLENKSDVPLPLDDTNAKPAENLGHDWLTAVERFAQSDAAKQIFGPAYQKVYADVRRDEIAQLTRILTAVEYRAYLSRL
ncbi:glutamine synthetase family protein [Aestuariibius sp. HNIBRBA575]|uniref:glutamine synthetase family protein n=1 Tax=Aestuariibius sp. HNIBRBA575 TaxID=3233343 RepID=UPI0034A3464B